MTVAAVASRVVRLKVRPNGVVEEVAVPVVPLARRDGRLQTVPVFRVVTSPESSKLLGPTSGGAMRRRARAGRRKASPPEGAKGAAHVAPNDISRADQGVTNKPGPSMDGTGAGVPISFGLISPGINFLSVALVTSKRRFGCGPSITRSRAAGGQIEPTIANL